jgi:hypothetical protein
LTIVHDSIATQIAELEQLVRTPTPPFGYGGDLSCVQDITATLDEVDPFSVRALAEAIIRRLSTARGTLIDDFDYGLDLRGFCSRGVPASELAELAGRVRLEISKDDRIDTATVSASYAHGELRLTVRITPFDAQLGGFRLTLAVTSAEVLIEAIEGAT